MHYCYHEISVSLQPFFLWQYDFTMMGGFLFVALIILICFGFLMIFFHNRVGTCTTFQRKHSTSILNLKFLRVLIQGSSGMFNCNRCNALIDSPDVINIKKTNSMIQNKCIYFDNNSNHTCRILYSCKGRGEKKIPAWDTSK